MLSIPPVSLIFGIDNYFRLFISIGSNTNNYNINKSNNIDIFSIRKIIQNGGGPQAYYLVAEYLWRYLCVNTFYKKRQKEKETQILWILHVPCSSEVKWSRIQRVFFLSSLLLPLITSTFKLTRSRPLILSYT